MEVTSPGVADLWVNVLHFLHDFYDVVSVCLTHTRLVSFLSDDNPFWGDWCPLSCVQCTPLAHHRQEASFVTKRRANSILLSSWNPTHWWTDTFLQREGTCTRRLLEDLVQKSKYVWFWLIVSQGKLLSLKQPTSCPFLALANQMFQSKSRPNNQLWFPSIMSTFSSSTTTFLLTVKPHRISPSKFSVSVTHSGRGGWEQSLTLSGLDELQKLCV